MKIRFVVIATFLMAAIPALAHHSFAMFELTKDVTYEGAVVEYRWENPHTHIIVKVDPGAADPSTVGTWDIEGGATNIMGRQGWTRATFKPGDHINAVAHPMKDGVNATSPPLMALGGVPCGSAMTVSLGCMPRTIGPCRVRQ